MLTLPFATNPAIIYAWTYKIGCLCVAVLTTHPLFFSLTHLPGESQEWAVIMVYKLHPGDIIRAELRWQGAVITAANKFIAAFFPFCTAHFMRHWIQRGMYFYPRWECTHLHSHTQMASWAALCECRKKRPLSSPTLIFFLRGTPWWRSKARQAE